MRVKSIATRHEDGEFSGGKQFETARSQSLGQFKFCGSQRVCGFFGICVSLEILGVRDFCEGCEMLKTEAERRGLI